VEEETMSFMFTYKRPGKPDRTVRIHSHYYLFLFECFEKIQEEIGWTRQLEEHAAAAAAAAQQNNHQ
jgi:sorting nexin-27